MPIRVLAIIAAAMCMACDSYPSDPAVGGVLSPSNVFDQQPPIPGMVPPLHAGVGAKGSNVTIGMFDNCDGDTFNADIGPGSCVRNGGMKFDHFIE
jgi:hypothetical protein